jgi:hypothetical protein
VNWSATDPHLEALPARVSVLTDWESDQGRPIEIAREQPEAGSVDYTIPANLMGDGFRIRVDAIDRAGNIGMAYSQTLQIEPDRMDGGTKPPVRVINHDENTPLVDSPVSTDQAPVTVEKSPTQTVSTPTSPVPASGEMLPLEEIPVSGSATRWTQPKLTHRAAESARSANGRAGRSHIAPTGGTTASTSPNEPTIEPLLLLPMTETPVQNSSAGNTSPIEPKQPAVSPQDDQTIVSDSPAETVAPTESSQNDSEYEEEDSVIRPVSAMPEPVENQSQASQNQDVECDSMVVRRQNADDRRIAAITDEAAAEKASAGRCPNGRPAFQRKSLTPRGRYWPRYSSGGLRRRRCGRAVARQVKGKQRNCGGSRAARGGVEAGCACRNMFSMVKTPSAEPPCLALLQPAVFGLV